MRAEKNIKCQIAVLSAENDAFEKLKNQRFQLVDQAWSASKSVGQLEKFLT